MNERYVRMKKRAEWKTELLRKKESWMKEENQKTINEKNKEGKEKTKWINEWMKKKLNEKIKEWKMKEMNERRK